MSDFVNALRFQRSMLRHYGVRESSRLNRLMLSARAACRRTVREGYYRWLSETELRALKSSSRAFVFGSGYSLNDLSAQEWRDIAAHNTIGFNAFVHQHWVRVDFHLVRSWGEGSDMAALPGVVDEFAELVAANPLYQDTVFVCQDDYAAVFPHSLIARHALRRDARIFPYTTNRTQPLPTRSFAEGLVHGTGTLCDAVNFAVCAGFEEIVLAGVDLYDTRYFWLEPDKTYFIDPATGMRVVQDTSDRGQRFDEPHSTATNGIVPVMDQWYRDLRERGVHLSVYNPKSLLSSVMPVFGSADGRAAGARRTAG